MKHSAFWDSFVIAMIDCVEMLAEIDVFPDSHSALPFTSRPSMQNIRLNDVIFMVRSHAEGQAEGLHVGWFWWWWCNVPTEKAQRSAC